MIVILECGISRQFSSSSLEALPPQLCHSDSYTANLAFETLVLLLEEINFGLGLLIELKLVRASFLHISPLTLAQPSLKMAPRARSFEVASYAYNAFSLVFHLVHSILLSASLLLQMVQVVPELVLTLFALISAIGMVNLD